MAYGSQSGSVAFRTQTARGQLATDIEDAGVAVPILSGSLTGNRELIVADAEIGGGRDISDAGLGPVSYSGDFEMYPRWESLLTFMNAAFGKTTTTTATGVNTHTIVPVDGSALPFLSVYEEISENLETAQYTDVVVNTFKLEVDPGSLVKLTVGLIGVKQLLGVPVLDLDGRWDSTEITVGTACEVRFDGTNAKAKSFTFELNNNFEDDDFRIGQYTLETLTPKRREITMTMGIRHESRDMMRQALNGSAVSVTPTGITTKKPMQIIINSNQEITGSTPATNYGLTLNVPRTIIEPFGFAPSGDDILENDITLRALRANAATPIVTATLKNSYAAVA